jgi:hypothetical protein
MMKFGVSYNMSLHNSFQKLPRRSLKTASNGKVKTWKLLDFVANLDIKSVPNELRMPKIKVQLLRSTGAVSGLRKPVMWLTQNLSIVIVSALAPTTGLWRTCSNLFKVRHLKLCKWQPLDPATTLSVRPSSHPKRCLEVAYSIGC